MALEVPLSQTLYALLMKCPESHTAQWANDITVVALEEAGRCPQPALDLALDVAAIMWRETTGGESPALDQKGPAGRGDAGHGHGLMQIDDRSHEEFLAKVNAQGVPLWQIPVENIRYVVHNIIVPDYRIFKGNKQAIFAAYNCGAGNVLHALAHGLDPDIHTAVGPSKKPDYGADVLRRRALFLG